MRPVLKAFAMMIIIASCTRNTQMKTPDYATTDICYAYYSEKDTIKISLTIEEKFASGELIYNFFEKDKNTGIVRGTFSGDTLIADYEFQSEGTTSVRNVKFLRKGNTLKDMSGLEMKEVKCK